MCFLFCLIGIANTIDLVFKQLAKRSCVAHRVLHTLHPPHPPPRAAIQITPRSPQKTLDKMSLSPGIARLQDTCSMNSQCLDSTNLAPLV